MLGIEVSYADALIDTMLHANGSLLSSTVERALSLSTTYGIDKGDTLGMDAIPEIAIADRIQRYDSNAILITEEVGESRHKNVAPGEEYRVTYICDPVDRSSQLKAFLEQCKDKSLHVKEALASKSAIKKWEQSNSAPASITGPCSAITCVYRGEPIISVILNLITQQLFVACVAGVYVIDVADCALDASLNHIKNNGKMLFFGQSSKSSKEDMMRFVTFLGKDLYRQNFLDSALMSESEMDEHLFYDLPGGPLRVLYLSQLQHDVKPIGFVFANGEKIGEWIHWIPFIRFGRMRTDQHAEILRLYEIYQDRPWTKEGILMATPPSYSIFEECSDGRMRINLKRFSEFKNPSRIRSTLLVAPSDNDWATGFVHQHHYRPIHF